MIFQRFRTAFNELGYFSSAQVNAWRPEFDKNNLGRWVKKGLAKISLTKKAKDFEHLLFDRAKSLRILQFMDFVEAL